MPYFELRQSPTDPCLLEQRQTSTGEWYTAFDYSLAACITRPETPDASRYNDDGILEVSYDDGATFEESRDLDPRFNSPLLPPLTSTVGETRRCEAANNVVGFMQDMANNTAANVSAFSTITGLIGALAGIIVAIISGGAAIPLLIGLAGALFAAGQAAFSAAMTAGVYETLLCIVYCETPDNGTYTEANWQAIKTQILIQLTGIAATFLHDNINAFGPAGLNNAARAGVDAGLPCDDCPCDNLCAEKYQIYQLDPAYGEILEYGDNYIIAACGASGYLTLEAIDFNDCCFVNSAELLTGTGGLTAWEGCGTEPSPPWEGSTPVGHCVSIIEAQFSVNGTIKIFLDDCP